MDTSGPTRAQRSGALAKPWGNGPPPPPNKSAEKRQKSRKAEQACPRTKPGSSFLPSDENSRNPVGQKGLAGLEGGKKSPCGPQPRYLWSPTAHFCTTRARLSQTSFYCGRAPAASVLRSKISGPNFAATKSR